MRRSHFLILLFVISLSVIPFSEDWEFSEPKLALDVGAPGEFDSLFVSDPCVIKVEENKYYMYYTGYGDDEKCRIGLAESTTCETWTKVGMVLDSGILTDLGVIDLMEPCVVIDEAPKNNILEVEKGTKIFRMWYAANTHRDNFIFYAESLDGITWQQKVLPVYGRLNGEKRVREPWVMKSMNMYSMFYNDGIGTNVLKSNDGIKWHYVGNFSRSNGGGIWNKQGVCSIKPFIYENLRYFTYIGITISVNGLRIPYLSLGLLSKDNRILELTEEPIVDIESLVFKYGVDSASGLCKDYRVKIWFSGINSLHPNVGDHQKVFFIEGEER